MSELFFLNPHSPMYELHVGDRIEFLDGMPVVIREEEL